MLLFAILATIANYQIVCCEAVRLAILATAWLLVCCVFVFSVLLFRVVFIFIIFMGSYSGGRPIPKLWHIIQSAHHFIFLLVTMNESTKFYMAHYELLYIKQ